LHKSHTNEIAGENDGKSATAQLSMCADNQRVQRKDLSLPLALVLLAVCADSNQSCVLGYRHIMSIFHSSFHQPALVTI
jgi:hypothetical protein